LNELANGPPQIYPDKQEKARFTAADIARAIESIEATGLKVLSVEITPNGAIKISIGPRKKPWLMHQHPRRNRTPLRDVYFTEGAVGIWTQRAR